MYFNSRRFYHNFGFTKSVSYIGRSPTQTLPTKIQYRLVLHSFDTPDRSYTKRCISYYITKKHKEPSSPAALEPMTNEKQRACPLCTKHPVVVTKSGTTQSYCKECARIKTIERQQAFKRACVLHKCKELGLPQGSCQYCNQVYEDCQLCFRHKVQRSDNVKVSKLTGSSNLSQRVKDELAKCELICHNCERLKFRSKRKPSQLKRKALDFLGGRCTKCNCDGPPSALEFHHKDPTKKTLQLGDRGLKSWDAIKNDIVVCEIICANCHSALHAEEKRLEREAYIKENWAQAPRA